MNEVDIIKAVSSFLDSSDITLQNLCDFCVIIYLCFDKSVMPHDS